MSAEPDREAAGAGVPRAAAPSRLRRLLKLALQKPELAATLLLVL